jgi:paraquat-inducible protein A
LTQKVTETVACSHCDLLQRIPPLQLGAKARCVRCGETLASAPADPIDRPLALTVASAVVFMIANTTPLLGLSVAGRSASTTLLGGAQQMWLQGQQLTALVVALCSVVAPAIYIVFMLTVLLALRRPPAPRWVGVLLRWAQAVQPWSMNEVMMLGILVALVKIAELATVIPGIGMYSVLVLILLLAATMANFDPREAWSRVVWADGSLPTAPTAPSGAGAAR